MGGRFLDWDTARAERAREPLIVRLFEQDWSLPADMPAEVMLEIVRLEAEEGPDSEVSDAQVFSALSRVVPADILEEWFARGLGAAELPALLVSILRLYQRPQAAASDEGRAEGEVPTPASSSSAGQR